MIIRGGFGAHGIMGDQNIFVDWFYRVEMDHTSWLSVFTFHHILLFWGAELFSSFYFWWHFKGRETCLAACFPCKGVLFCHPRAWPQFNAPLLLIMAQCRAAWLRRQTLATPLWAARPVPLWFNVHLPMSAERIDSQNEGVSPQQGETALMYSPGVSHLILTTCSIALEQRNESMSHCLHKSWSWSCHWLREGDVCAFAGYVASNAAR